ncbi:hypothetical protein WJX82_005944 [Trebouxia sp. C0006]
MNRVRAHIPEPCYKFQACLRLGSVDQVCCRATSLRPMLQHSNQKLFTLGKNRPRCWSQMRRGALTDGSKQRLPVGASHKALHPKRFKGISKEKKEAAKAFDAAKIFLGQDPVNFDIDDFDPVEIRASASTLDEFVASMRKQSWAAKGTGFKHVQQAKGKFQARVTLLGRTQSLGVYVDAEEAAKAADAARIFVGQDPVNFDLDDYDAVEIKASASTIGEYSAGVRMNTRKNATGHRFKMIFKLKSGKYRAHLPIHGKSKHLGVYMEAEEAAKVVVATKIFLGQHPVNFDIDDFDPVEVRASASTINEFIASMKRPRKKHKPDGTTKLKSVKSSRSFKLAPGPAKHHSQYKQNQSQMKSQERFMQWRAASASSKGHAVLPCVTTKEAAKAVDAARIFVGQDPVNFDLDYYNTVEIRASASTIEEYTAGVRMENRKNAKGNRFRYISKQKSGEYKALLPINGKQKHLGIYTYAEEAAKAVDAAKIFLGQNPINFSVDDFDVENICTSASTLDEFIAGMKRPRKKHKHAGTRKQKSFGSSRFLSVAKSADTKFKAYVLLHGKQVYLGHYSDENQAARAADTAKIYKDMGKLNFPEEEYNVADIKASASTFDDLVATSRRKARRVVSRKWHTLGFYTSWSSAATAVDKAFTFLGEEPRCLPQSQYDAHEIRASARNVQEFARRAKEHADRALREASHLVPGKSKGNMAWHGKYFQTRCCHDGNYLHLGCFVEKDDAARAIDMFLIYTGRYPAHFHLEGHYVGYNIKLFIKMSA